MPKDTSKEWNVKGVGDAMQKKPTPPQDESTVTFSVNGRAPVTIKGSDLKKAAASMRPELFDADKHEKKNKKASLEKAKPATTHRLKSFIERVEKLEEERKEISTDIKEVFGEARAFGFDCKAIRTILKLRRMDSQKRQEEEGVLQTYMAALGME